MVRQQTWQGFGNLDRSAASVGSADVGIADAISITWGSVPIFSSAGLVGLLQTNFFFLSFARIVDCLAGEDRSQGLAA
jgi:hypothetical protein